MEQRFNLVDRFFDHLRDIVAGRLGLPQAEVAFRDTARLEVGEIWPDALTEGLQQTDTLIALISPNYLRSRNCGREFQFILDRFGLLREERKTEAHTHRILPVYWESPLDLNFERQDSVKQVLDAIQFKTADQMPENYPVKGLRQLMLVSSLSEREKLCESLATRIVAHFHADPMPKHPQPRPFSQLNTAFGERVPTAQLPVGSGPNVAQVVYAVPEQREAATGRLDRADQYAEDRESWEPFSDAPGATVGAATHEGIRRVRGTKYISWGWPDNLMSAVIDARRRNSIVLFVLDRNAVRLPQYAQPMSDYSVTDLPNTCLVTAAGDNVSDTQIQSVFDTKFVRRHPHHVWSIPTTRNDYVASVETTIAAVKRELMKRGETSTTFRSSSLPILTVTRQ